MMDRQKLQDAVDAKTIPVYMTNVTDIIEYFRDTHGEKNWKSELAMKYSGTTDKKSRAYKSAMRQFQKEKGVERYKKEKAKGATKARYEAIGRTLPPIGKKFPGNTLTLTVYGTQHEKGGSRDRDWTATFTGVDAYNFVNNPTYVDFFRQLDTPYDFNIIEQFDGDDSAAVEVTHVA